MLTMSRLALIVFSGLSFFEAFAAAEIGYAQSTGYYKKDTRPTLYQPLNLLDGREATCWCTSSADPLSDTLTFGFKTKAKIDEIRIYTGNGFDSGTFKAFARAKKISIQSVSETRRITLPDQRGQQSITLNPPMVGEKFTVEVVDQYHAEDPEAPVCMTDVVFYSDGKALNGPWLTQKLKYDKPRAGLLGTWYSGIDGAPDRFLSFYFDGSFRLVYSPFDTGTAKGHIWSGDYEISGSRITFEQLGKNPVVVSVKKETREGTGAESPQRSLKFEGGTPEDLRTPFRDHP